MYCTQTDIEQRRISTATLIQLTDDADTGAVDAAVVAGAITEAAGTVDGFLRGRYPLPLNPVPEIITTIALDVSVYYLYARKPEFDPPEAVSDRYKSAVALLQRIQDGKMPLYETSAPPATGPSVVSYSGPERLFSRKTLRGF